MRRVKVLAIIVFLLVGIESFSQVNILAGIADSISMIQQLEFQIEKVKLFNDHVSPNTWSPDTIFIQAEVININNKRHGYLIDIFDSNQNRYYKIVSWKSKPNNGNKIEKHRLYNFKLWAAGPGQVGDITFKPKLIKQGEKKIRISYRNKQGIELSTFYFTTNLVGLTYYNSE